MILLPTAKAETPLPEANIDKQVTEPIQPVKVETLPQPVPEAKTVSVEKPVSGRVFCGTPKQRNWKNINLGNAEIGKKLASDKGWSGDQYEALLELWACESSWNHLAGNTESGAYGIPQSLPASKMAKYGEDYLTNPITQIKWGLDYIASRYGNPKAALAFHYTNNWY